MRFPGQEYITPTYIPGPGELPQFPLGLDRFGGDVLSKLIWGAQASLIIGVVSTAFGLVGGMLIGLIAGMFGGKVDNILMRFVDILLSVPSLLLAVSIAALLGQTPFSVMIAIGVAQVPIFARLLRSSMLAAAQCRLRAVGPDARPRPRHDHDEPRAAELGRAGHRAGHPEPGDGRHRRGGAVLPRPRRRAPRDRGVGPHADLRAGRARHRAVARVPPRHLHHDHRAGLHAAGRGAARGDGPAHPRAMGCAARR